MQEEAGNILERARTVLAELEAIQQAAAQAAGQITAVREAANAEAESIEKAAATVQAQQAVNAQNSQYIEEARAHAAECIAALNADRTSCTTTLGLALTAAEGAKASATEAAASATTAGDAQAEADNSRDEARAAAEAVKVHQRDLQALAAVADSKEARVQEYEAQLKALMDRCMAQQEEITKLLPGATSAGLASAYRTRRGAFVWPAWIWQGIFVIALVALIILAAYGLADTRTSTGAVRELPELMRLWMTRLPIAGALIWLALHAGQEGALARRLEEDYSYKETVAASFQGFQEQMARIAKDTAPESALARLCNDVLATLAAPPGRIYEKHALAAVPSDLIKKVVDGVADKLKGGGTH